MATWLYAVARGCLWVPMCNHYIMETPNSCMVTP
jgi:hypothetical protein